MSEWKTWKKGDLCSYWAANKQQWVSCKILEADRGEARLKALETGREFNCESLTLMPVQRITCAACKAEIILPHKAEAMKSEEGEDYCGTCWSDARDKRMVERERDIMGGIIVGPNGLKYRDLPKDRPMPEVPELVEIGLTLDQWVVFSRRLKEVPEEEWEKMPTETRKKVLLEVERFAKDDTN